MVPANTVFIEPNGARRQGWGGGNSVRDLPHWGLTSEHHERDLTITAGGDPGILHPSTPWESNWEWFWGRKPTPSRCIGTPTPSKGVQSPRIPWLPGTGVPVSPAAGRAALLHQGALLLHLVHAAPRAVPQRRQLHLPQLRQRLSKCSALWATHQPGTG